MPALIQQSTVLCRDRKLLQFFTSPVNVSAAVNSTPQYSAQNSLILSSNLAPAPYTSSCGHKMHTECFKNLKDINTDSEEMDLSVPFIFESEFKCPLCNTVSNAVLPVFPSVDDMVQYLPHEATVAVSFDNWYLSLKIIHKGLVSIPTNIYNIVN
jgi:E3 ubiquitin-protein ligase UBR2